MRDRKLFGTNMDYPKAKLKEMYKSMSFKQMARKLNCSSATVWKYCKKYGIKSRPVGKTIGDVWNKGLKGWAGIGKDHPNFRGGKNIATNGYVRTLVEGTGAYELEHRKVMEDFLGRKLSSEESVHHKDGDRENNEIRNLELIASRSAHTKLHEEFRVRNQLGQYI